MNTRRAPTPDPTSGTRPQRAEPHAIGLLPAGSAVAQGIVARMGGDYLAGTCQDDQSPVLTLPGCAIALPSSYLAIECWYVADTSEHYRACEMRDNSCIALQIVEFSRI